MRRLWTLQRVSGAGVMAGLAALALWPFSGLYGTLLLWTFVLLAAVAAVCGFSILAITVLDMATRPRRGSRIRPLRSFDTALATLLLVLSWFELRDAFGMLPA